MSANSPLRWTTISLMILGMTSGLWAQSSSFTGFTTGNLVVSRSVYVGDANTVQVGQSLPPVCPASAEAAKKGQCSAGKATVNGTYPGVWANERSNVPQSVFSPALLQWPDFQVGEDGSFKGVVDVNGFSARRSAATEALIRERASADESVRRLEGHALHATKVAFAPQLIDAEVTQNYALQTGMWVGATLEQGVWYELSAPLSLPGAPQIVVTHRLEFAYTRQVACTSESTDRACVEIVIHATPDQEALAAAVQNFPAPADVLQYTVTTYVRLVTDPETLLPHVRETRRYWYLALGDPSDEALFESERLVSSVRYP